MDPKVVYASALAWRMLDLVQDMKRSADGLVEAGRLDVAVDRYNYIIGITKSNAVFHFKINAVFDTHCSTPLGLVNRVIMDTTATGGFLLIRQGDLKTAAALSRAASWLLNFHATLPDCHRIITPQSGRDNILGAQAPSWFNILVGFLTKRPPRDLVPMHQVLQNLSGMLGDRPHLSHDIGVLKVFTESAEVCQIVVTCLERLYLTDIPPDYGDVCS